MKLILSESRNDTVRNQIAMILMKSFFNLIQSDVKLQYYEYSEYLKHILRKLTDPYYQCPSDKLDRLGFAFQSVFTRFPFIVSITPSSVLFDFTNFPIPDDERFPELLAGQVKTNNKTKEIIFNFKTLIDADGKYFPPAKDSRNNSYTIHLVQINSDEVKAEQANFFDSVEKLFKARAITESSVLALYKNLIKKICSNQKQQTVLYHEFIHMADYLIHGESVVANPRRIKTPYPDQGIEITAYIHEMLKKLYNLAKETYDAKTRQPELPELLLLCLDKNSQECSDSRKFFKIYYLDRYPPDRVKRTLKRIKSLVADQLLLEYRILSSSTKEPKLLNKARSRIYLMMEMLEKRLTE